MSYAGNLVTSPRGLIQVGLLMEGVSQPFYRGPHGDLFVAASPGTRYVLQVRNLAQDSRVEIINTVDGRNTLKDEKGDFRANTGLVFPADGLGEFTGWRISDAETREFIFGSPERSVAAQATGSTSNTGIIGFAAYRERLSYPSPSYSYPQRKGGLESFNAVASPGLPVTRGMGTGIGASRSDHVGTTTFNRDTATLDLLTISYDSLAVLQEMRVIDNDPPVTRHPSAFPGSLTGYEKYI